MNTATETADEEGYEHVAITEINGFNEANPFVGVHQNINELLAALMAQHEIQVAVLKSEFEIIIADLEIIILTNVTEPLKTEISKLEKKVQLREGDLRDHEAHSEHVQTHLRRRNCELESKLERLQGGITPTGGLSSSYANDIAQDSLSSEGEEGAEHDDYVYIGTH